MGLPIWRDPDEVAKAPVTSRRTPKSADYPAVMRSAIRRRPTYGRGRFPRLARLTSPPPPLVPSSPQPALPPAPHMSNASLTRRPSWQRADDQALGPRDSSNQREGWPRVLTPPNETSADTSSARSVSPVDFDTWHLMRSSIQSDTMLPTADSSFASAAVSASMPPARTDRTAQPASQAASTRAPATTSAPRNTDDRQRHHGVDCLIDDLDSDFGLSLLDYIRHDLGSVRDSLRGHLDGRTHVNTERHHDRCLDPDHYRAVLDSISGISSDIGDQILQWSNAHGRTNVDSSRRHLDTRRRQEFDERQASLYRADAPAMLDGEARRAEVSHALDRDIRSFFGTRGGES